MHPMDQDMRRCVEECLACHRTCVTMASQHCLDVGGKHVEPRHFRLMLACADLPDLRLLHGARHRFHKRTCAVCAEVCEECARSCEEIGDMDECVAACRRCAESCRRWRREADQASVTRSKRRNTGARPAARAFSS